MESKRQCVYDSTMPEEHINDLKWLTPQFLRLINSSHNLSKFSTLSPEESDRIDPIFQKHTPIQYSKVKQ